MNRQRAKNQSNSSLPGADKLLITKGIKINSIRRNNRISSLMHKTSGRISKVGKRDIIILNVAGGNENDH